jgi:nitrate reductase gamma subunit
MIHCPAQDRRSSLRDLVALLLLLLVALAGIAEAGHSHKNDAAATAKTCPICIAAQHKVATQAVALKVVKPVNVVVEAAQQNQPVLHSQLAALVVSIRPPPQA